MTKNLIQDVVPPEKKSIRNIPVPDRKLRSRFASSRAKKTDDIRGVDNSDTITPKMSAENEDSFIDATTPPVSQEESPTLTTGNNDTVANLSRGGGANFVVTGHADSYAKRKRVKVIAGVFGILVFGIAMLFVMGIFSRVNISIVKHSELAMLSPGAISVEYGENSKTAHIVTTEHLSGVRVAATEEEYIKTKASGKIVVYNDFGSASQKLIQNTRFEAPNGKIYRIKDPIVVPGKTSNGPGSIEVTVYADSEGESYNIDLVDFTIPGFKGTPQFEGFYARSKTAMTGGFDGVVKKVSDQDKASALAKIESEIKEKILSEAKSSTPEGYVYFESLLNITYTELPQSDIKNDSVQINLKGVATLPVFDAESFAKILSENSDKIIPASDKYYIKNLDDLNVAYAAGSLAPTASSGKLSLSVTGQPIFEWEVDQDMVKSDLVGTKRSAMNSVFEKYKAIESAKSSVFPMWLGTLPDSKDKINIEFVDNN